MALCPIFSRVCPSWSKITSNRASNIRNEADIQNKWPCYYSSGRYRRTIFVHKEKPKALIPKKSTPGTTHQPRQTQCTLIDDTYREKNEANPLDNSMPEKMVKAVSPVELSKLKFMDEASHDS